MSEDVLQQLMLWCVNSYYMPVQKATIMWEHDCLDLDQDENQIKRAKHFLRDDQDSR